MASRQILQLRRAALRLPGGLQHPVPVGIRPCIEIVQAAPIGLEQGVPAPLLALVFGQPGEDLRELFL